MSDMQQNLPQDSADRNEALWAEVFATIAQMGMSSQGIHFRSFIAPLEKEISMFIPAGKAEAAAKKVMQIDLDLIKIAAVFQDRFSALVLSRSAITQEQPKKVII